MNIGRAISGIFSAILSNLAVCVLVAIVLIAMPFVAISSWWDEIRPPTAWVNKDSEISYTLRHDAYQIERYLNNEIGPILLHLSLHEPIDTLITEDMREKDIMVLQYASGNAKRRTKQYLDGLITERDLREYLRADQIKMQLAYYGVKDPNVIRKVNEKEPMTNTYLHFTDNPPRKSYFGWYLFGAVAIGGTLFIYISNKREKANRVKRR